jgi:hypothetical protein
MGMTIKIEGLDRYIACLAKAPDSIKREMRITMKEGLQAIDREARNNHWYRSRSGNLERSNDIAVSNDGLTGTVTLSKTKAKAPYAWRIHEGFVGQTDSLGRIFSGPKPDQFLYHAAERRENKLKQNMEYAVERGLVRAGL